MYSLSALNLLVSLKASNHFHVNYWYTNNSDCRICRCAVINLRTKFHMPSFCGSLGITIKPNGKEHFCMATMLFYIVQNNYLNKHCIFYGDLLLYVITAPCYRWYCSHLTSSRVHHVIFTDCKKLKCTRLGWSLAWLHTKFCWSLSFQKLNVEDKHRQHGDLIE
jgi:hypothetical protein